MNESVRRLLREVIDYAGHFPPTALPLAEAVRNYAGYRQTPEGWLLSRFICPAKKLADVAPDCRDLFDAKHPARLAVVGAQNPLTPEFLLDVRLLEQFTAAHGDIAHIEALELRVPQDALREWRPEAIGEALDVMATRLVEQGFGDVEVFLEPADIVDWPETLQRAVAALRFHDETRGQPNPERIGLKLRTGGAAPAVVPTAQQLALAITACRDAGVPLKFTGGLHHALRRIDAATQQAEHGFLNVFVAAVLAYARGASAETVRDVLEERTGFAFTADGLRWRELAATLAEIDATRDEFAVSFGSCSFDEPRATLHTLGLL